MNSIEASNFFDNHVQGRFSKWEPESAEVDDWLFYIKGMAWDVALKAIREHKSSYRYNAPALSVFRTKARGFMPTPEKVERPGNTVFVFYEGGGRGTLQPGFFIPIIVLPHEQHLVMKAAENTLKMYQEGTGGEWKIYSPTTSGKMIKMRADIRGAIVNRTGCRISK